MTQFLRTSKPPRWHIAINLFIAITMIMFLNVPTAQAECGEWYDWATLGISCVVKLITEEECEEEDETECEKEEIDGEEKITSCGTAFECYQKAQQTLEQAQALVKAQQTKTELLLNKQQTENQQIIAENQQIVDENKTLLSEHQNWLEKHQATLALLQQQVTTQERYENIRALVPREMVDNQICPTGSKAAYMPLSYRGKSGNEICAAHRGQEKSCQSIRYLYLKSSNRFSTHFDTNKLHEKSCQSTVPVAWPWGISNTEPTTAPGASAGSTWIICCQ